MPAGLGSAAYGTGQTLRDPQGRKPGDPGYGTGTDYGPTAAAPRQDPTFQTGGYANVAAPIAANAATNANAASTTQAPTPAVAPADQTAMDETRRQQQEALAGLQQAASGAAPSVAEQQLHAAMNRAASQQMGAAAQARGGDQIALQREAMLGIGQQGLEAGTQAGAARAAEMTGARQALGTAVGQARGQDQAFATDMASLRAQVAAGNVSAAVALAGQAVQRYGMDLQSELTKRGLDQQWQLALQQKDANKLNAIIQGIVVGGAAIAGGVFGGPGGAALGAQLGGSVAPAISSGIQTSDERIKSNVSAVPDDELGHFANKVAESIFSYNKAGAPNREAGTMAQDVASAGPLGQEVTGEVSPGTMGVDYGRLATLMAAAALRSKKDRV